ncbi:HGxxPAAW family protein [Kineococcus glutinatus]|uniref:DUF3040 family protein n=1 Tax=Kineococcus glutinatus TaxID=1070872 RepID=A0ABP8VDS3_9ACTN
MEQSGSTAGRQTTAAQASHNARHDGPAEIVDEHGHGSTPAAWTGVGICLVGSLVVSLAVVFTHLVTAIVGAVIVLAAPVVAKVMSKAGKGATGRDGRPAGTGRATSH